MPAETRKERFSTRRLDRLSALLIALALLGSLLHLSVGDRWAPLVIFNYALPGPVIVALFAIAGILAWRRRRTLIFAWLLGLAVAIAWAASHHYHHSCRSEAPGLRVVLWNVGRGWAGTWEELAQTIAEQAADLVVLVESGPTGTQADTFWIDRFPSLKVARPGGGITLLARGGLADARLHPLNPRGNLVDAIWQVDGLSLRIVAVDLPSTPWRSRQPGLAAVQQLVETGVKPSIVLGDFNTPIESTWFAALRRDYRHAFEAAGNGWLVTWPVPLPVLALDHIWVGHDLPVRCAAIVTTWRSDHALVRADLAVGSLPVLSSRDKRPATFL